MIKTIGSGGRAIGRSMGGTINYDVDMLVTYHIENPNVCTFCKNPPPHTRQTPIITSGRIFRVKFVQYCFLFAGQG